MLTHDSRYHNRRGHFFDFRWNVRASVKAKLIPDFGHSFPWIVDTLVRAQVQFNVPQDKWLPGTKAYFESGAVVDHESEPILPHGGSMEFLYEDAGVARADRKDVGPVSSLRSQEHWRLALDNLDLVKLGDPAEFYERTNVFTTRFALKAARERLFELSNFPTGGKERKELMQGMMDPTAEVPASCIASGRAGRGTAQPVAMLVSVAIGSAAVGEQAVMMSMTLAPPTVAGAADGAGGGVWGGVPRGGGDCSGDGDDGTSATTSSADGNRRGCMANVPSSRSSIQTLPSATLEAGEAESGMELDLEDSGAAAAESGGERGSREKAINRPVGRCAPKANAKARAATKKIAKKGTKRSAGQLAKEEEVAKADIKRKQAQLKQQRKRARRAAALKADPKKAAKAAARKSKQNKELYARSKASKRAVGSSSRRSSDNVADATRTTTATATATATVTATATATAAASATSTATPTDTNNRSDGSGGSNSGRSSGGSNRSGKLPALNVWKCTLCGEVDATFSGVSCTVGLCDGYICHNCARQAPPRTEPKCSVCKWA
jgi:hypothetical protein